MKKICVCDTAKLESGDATATYQICISCGADNASAIASSESPPPSVVVAHKLFVIAVCDPEKYKHAHLAPLGKAVA
jgi:hypothetical protein